jgi:2-methylcitrate dehydratase PrpD
LGVTADVAAFACRTRWTDLPREVVAIAGDHILDTFGVMLAGSPEPCAALVRRVCGAEAGPCPVFGTRERRSPALAALANGVAGHALDYDDTQLSTSPEAVYGLLTHPSVPVLSAAAALAETRPCSGQDLITAYVIGVEVACRVADAANPRHYQHGFHTTGTVGTIGAAAAAGHLLGLDPEAMARALGIAASMASGLRENFGTMTKPLHSGRAGHNGLLAALLAQEGFTASPAILEAKRGFYQAAAGGFSPEKVALGNPFFLQSPGVSIKPYPSGSLSHPGQDLILDIVRRSDLRPEQVASVVVGTNSNVPNALIYSRPHTELEAKFSLEYCMATGVLRRRAGLAEFTDAAVNDPSIQAFLPKVQVVVDPELERMGYQHVRTRVTVTCTDGRVLHGEAEYARGYPGNPLPAGDLEAKFRECARCALSSEQAEAALHAIRGLAGAASASAVLDALRPQGGTQRV